MPNKSDAGWNHKYALAKAYYDKFGNLDLASAYVAEDGTRLGAWILRLRHDYNKDRSLIPEDRIALLEAIGMSWEKKTDPDNSLALSYLARYKEKHGNLDVPSSYVTKDGFALGRWVVKKRSFHHQGKLNEQIKEKLDAMGFVWEPDFEKWKQMFLMLWDYKKRYGYCYMHKIYRTEEGVPLGEWLLKQCMALADTEKPMPDDKAELLEQLGITKKTSPTYLQELACKPREFYHRTYPALKEYHEKHGNLQVGYNQTTEDGFNIGSHVLELRKRYKKQELTNVQIEMLQTLDFTWNTSDEQWEKMYQKAKAYFDEHGNLEVKKSHVLPTGEKLGSWLATQRQVRKGTAGRKEKMPEERIQRLDEIGMIW